MIYLLIMVGMKIKLLSKLFSGRTFILFHAFIVLKFLLMKRFVECKPRYSCSCCLLFDYVFDMLFMVIVCDTVVMMIN